MIDLFEDVVDDYLPGVSPSELSDEKVLVEIAKIKTRLADKVVILGHHYQQDDIIRFADITGDSLVLAKKAVALNKQYIIFCGVHFMAETADILSAPDQMVILPDMNAGCSMADMANRHQVERAWKHISSITFAKIVPVTYINCSADLKAFVGEHGGSICTSSNAEEVIKWALAKGEKLLFFPDQHLGRNTCFKLGIPLSEMVLYDPNKENGGASNEELAHAKIILWYGYCSVHQGFTKAQIDNFRKNEPNTKIIVHPECPFDVVQNADDAGSTARLIEIVKNSPDGSSFAIGTEINLVNRLAADYPTKKIVSLSPYQCLCTTMYRVRPRWLLSVLKAIEIGKPINVIKVPTSVAKMAQVALEQMLKISK